MAGERAGSLAADKDAELPPQGPGLGIPNRKPQEYGRNMQEIFLPGSLDSYHIPAIFLGLLVGVPLPSGGAIVAWPF